MSKTKQSGDYDVGYKKPPRATQFKRGQSGNPKGRPKGAKNFASHIESTFARKISVHEKGKERRISMAEAILLKLTAKAISGDMSATRLAIGLLQLSQQEGGKPITDSFTSESDRALLLAFLAENVPDTDKGEL